MKKYLDEYCVGCGLCHSLNKATLKKDVKGYLHPTDGDREWLGRICPAGGSQCKEIDTSQIWGRTLGVYYGYSNDEHVRKKASSGGILTEIAAYLLESGKVDAILHTHMDPSSPIDTATCISYSKEELVERCGSRYAISHPLSNLLKLKEGKYAFVGKPCDVTALKNYMRIYPEIKKKIPITLSFFCAGLPSVVAQRELLHQLGCTGEIESLHYRGNGWPGYATAIQKDGTKYQMDYDSLWGKILGRDVMKMCRFCLDGIGEMADISCGDAWYLTDELQPDFSEHEGRNVVFARSQIGKNILTEARDQNRITIEPFLDYNEKLKCMQKYQYDRRATMLSKSVAMKLLLRPFPKYRLSCLKKFASKASLLEHMKIVKGTAVRVIKGRL